MRILPEPLSFEWDKGNIDKNYQKHWITPNEAEEVFLDDNAITLDDESHSVSEKRLNVIGKTMRKTVLFVAFTLRSKRIRIISARIANKKVKARAKNQRS